MQLAEMELKELKIAKSLLENSGLAARITDFIGKPIEKGFDLLPEKWNENIGEVTQTALLKASKTAIFTMKDIPGEESSNVWHKLGVATCGGVGGFFGMAGLSVELPISTTIMLRSIADIARSEGESIASVDTKLACLEVLALGGKNESDDDMESGYYAVRYALAYSVTEAAKHIAKKGVTQKSAPALIKFITNISYRFGIQVTQKAIAQAIPAIGAAGGAIINTMFIDYFQDMARGHFIVRKLDRKYSTDIIKEIYESLPK